MNVAFLNRARVTRGMKGKTTLRFADGFTVHIAVSTGDGPELRLTHYPNNDDDDPD